jgi:hypothetical protein
MRENKWIIDFDFLFEWYDQEREKYLTEYRLSRKAKDKQRAWDAYHILDRCYIKLQNEMKEPYKEPVKENSTVESNTTKSGTYQGKELTAIYRCKTCSECGEVVPIGNYCYNCGATMTEE